MSERDTGMGAQEQEAQTQSERQSGTKKSWKRSAVFRVRVEGALPSPPSQPTNQPNLFLVLAELGGWVERRGLFGGSER